MELPDVLIVADKRDGDMYHFYGEFRGHERLMATVHVDDLELFFGEDQATNLRHKINKEGGAEVCVQLLGV